MESPEPTLKRKRDQWNDEEIKTLLELIKDKYLSALLGNKTKRNKKIYTHIEQDLKKEDIFKSCDQIRNKFKYLKCDYLKIKRKNNKSGAQRQTSAHFELLDEMFNHRPSLTASCEDTCDFETDIPIENPTPIVVKRTRQEIPDNTTAETLEEGPSSSTAIISKKSKKISSYEKVLESFTSQWQKAHMEIMKKMMERDEKNWERLEEHRRETDRILEKDRQETAQILRSIFQFASCPGTQSPQQTATLSSVAEDFQNI